MAPSNETTHRGSIVVSNHNNATNWRLQGGFGTMEIHGSSRRIVFERRSQFPFIRFLWVRCWSRGLLNLTVESVCWWVARNACGTLVYFSLVCLVCLFFFSFAICTSFASPFTFPFVFHVPKSRSDAYEWHCVGMAYHPARDTMPQSIGK